MALDAREKPAEKRREYESQERDGDCGENDPE